MQEVCNWFLTNWQLVAVIGLFIGSVIISLCTKKPVTDIISLIYRLVPGFINEFEEPGSGSEKKKAVITAVLMVLKDKYPSLAVDKYEKIISEAIEIYLSTPQKKGE